MERYVIEQLKSLLDNVNYLNGDYNLKSTDDYIIVEDENDKKRFNLSADELNLFVPLHTELYIKLREFVFNKTKMVVRFYTDDDGNYSTILAYDTLHRQFLFTDNLVQSDRFMVFFDNGTLENIVKPFLKNFSCCGYTIEKILN